MPRNVTKPRAAAKQVRFQKRNQNRNSGIDIRNQNGKNRNQLSPVTDAVKAMLPANKAAQHLALLIDEPLGNCQKLLCGHRGENAAQLTKLLRSEFGREVLFALMGEARPEWFSKYRKQLDVNAARKQLDQSRRALDALQAEASR